MTFTSNLFLIGLLPFFAVIYNWLRDKNTAARKVLLLLANSLFLIWGGVGSLLFLCAFSCMVFLFAKIVCKTGKRSVLALSICLSLVPLVVIKYTMFMIETINTVTGYNTVVPSIVVPTGISFITFEAVSLLVDIFRGIICKNPSLIDTFLYLGFFPTVSSGPITRYQEFIEGLHDDCTPCDYTLAVTKISVGLCKKVLIADKIAVLADYYFDGAALGHSFSCLGLWIGSIAYSIQLYFDFSGYSDMAVGIGQLLGFNLSENFNKPYQASSISDFWKRWHISLTRWFRDYVYIPLGGNRCSKYRHILNMLLVWLLTGIWHGANWTFIVWGIGYFLLLVSEKYCTQKLLQGSKFFSHLYTLFFVNLLWVPFRTESLSDAANYLAGMFSRGSSGIEEIAVRFFPLILIAIVLCLPWDKFYDKFLDRRWFVILRGFVFIALVFLALCGSINSSYTPYIYGSF